MSKYIPFKSLLSELSSFLKGASVDVIDPVSDNSTHTCAFSGTVASVHEKGVCVSDREDNHFDVDFDEVEIDQDTLDTLKKEALIKLMPIADSVKRMRANDDKAVVLNAYPESLHSRCQYLEKVNANLREGIDIAQAEFESLRTRLSTVSEGVIGHIVRDQTPRMWVWQGDGYDLTRSMADDLPVLIRADELRELIEHGEIIAET